MLIDITPKPYLTCKDIDKSIVKSLPKEGDFRNEQWNGYKVLFFYHKDDWWALAKDIAFALGYSAAEHLLAVLDDFEISKMRIKTSLTNNSEVNYEANSLDSSDLGNTPSEPETNVSQSVVDSLCMRLKPKRGSKSQEYAIISESGIFHASCVSRLPEAKEFRIWLFEVAHKLRVSIGLTDTQVMRMLDKENQKRAMSKLKEGLELAKKVYFIKANMIANKAVSNVYDFPKAVKKENMSQEMLALRQEILDKTTALMLMKDDMDLSLSVSDTIYKKYSKKVN
jgi:prophage antirepressor-like protein